MARWQRGGTRFSRQEKKIDRWAARPGSRAEQRTLRPVKKPFPQPQRKRGSSRVRKAQSTGRSASPSKNDTFSKRWKNYYHGLRKTGKPNSKRQAISKDVTSKSRPPSISRRKTRRSRTGGQKTLPVISQSQHKKKRGTFLSKK